MTRAPDTHDEVSEDDPGVSVELLDADVIARACPMCAAPPGATCRTPKGTPLDFGQAWGARYHEARRTGTLGAAQRGTSHEAGRIWAERNGLPAKP